MRPTIDAATMTDATGARCTRANYLDRKQCQCCGKPASSDRVAILTAAGKLRYHAACCDWTVAR